MTEDSAPRIHLAGSRGVQIGDGNTMHVHPRIAWGSMWPDSGADGGVHRS
ncbi:hypothetical protein DMA12_03620 [Amycolatopsis balhimycina DSM 5908]|uniref:Uncharacterized protein n=1 Tax=Amycolatopsis balhimycina DSM 5908 TaxID=1081091 RepID=A0A428X2I5_AMYBA|nr:RIP homotypic interaction motif-containing protein [Amycolatopsis balhimycina]RSM49526.1 hypothetical protein DMA12_03620 [Amycolatopsis balhimycina DSM 5908]